MYRLQKTALKILEITYLIPRKLIEYFYTKYFIITLSEHLNIVQSRNLHLKKINQQNETRIIILSNLRTGNELNPLI